MSQDKGIDALLSSKDPASDELLSASPTVEGKLEASVTCAMCLQIVVGHT